MDLKMKIAAGIISFDLREYIKLPYIRQIKKKTCVAYFLSPSD